MKATLEGFVALCVLAGCASGDSGTNDVAADVKVDTSADVAGDSGPSDTGDIVTLDDGDGVATIEDSTDGTTIDGADDTAETSDITDDSGADGDDTGDTSDDTDDTVDVPPDVTNPPSGESCGDAFVVELPASFTTPVVVSGDTTGHADDHETGEGDCRGVPWPLGVGAPDEVWRFTAPVAGSYRITLTSDVADLVFYVLAGCDEEHAGTCLRAADDFDPNGAVPDVGRVTLAAGQSIAVVVDSYTDGLTGPSEGAYTLTFDAPRPAPLGDACESPLVLQTGPGGFVGAGDNGTGTTLSDDYDALTCVDDPFDVGFGAADQVWRFTAPAAGRWGLQVAPSAAADPMMYVYTHDTCAGTCAAFSDAIGDGKVEHIDMDLAAGDSVWIIVDAFAPELGGQYVITAALGCTPACTPGSCAFDGCGERCPCGPDEICDLVDDTCGVCQPSCPNEACGVDDGCGGECTCVVGDVCDPVASACATARSGDRCDDPKPLTASNGALVGTGDLKSGRADDVVLDACPGSDDLASDGDGTPDEVFTFVATTSDDYVVSVTSAAGVDVLFALFAGTSCASAACLGASDDGGLAGVDHGTFALIGGNRYTLVVDTGALATAGAYTVDVRVKVPDPVLGDACTLPFTLASSADPDVLVGIGDLGDVDGDPKDPDDFEVGACPDLGAATFPPDGIDTPDQVFALSVPRNGDYVITLAPEAPATDLFLQVLAGPTCAAASCLGFADDAFAGEDETVTLTLSAATDYWLVVDTYVASAGGAYTLTVAPAPCVGDACTIRPGDDCDDPYVLTDATAADGDLAPAAVADDFSLAACSAVAPGSRPAPADGSADEVFAFDVPGDGLYRFDVTPTDTDDDLAFGVFTGASCAVASCSRFVDVAAGHESAVVALSGGTTAYLVVEASSAAAPGSNSGAYSVAVSPVTASNACAGATTLELGVPLTGTTTSAGDDLDALGCSVAGVDGSGLADVVYALAMPASGDYQITLTPSSADLALYALTASGAACYPDLCRGAANGAGAGQVETITVSADTGSGASPVDDLVYLVVDGGAAAAAGAFVISTATTIGRCADDLYFSEYIEGSSNNKGLEIYNGTGADVQLGNYVVRVQQNGSTGVGSYRTQSLAGTLAPGATYRLCNSGLANQTCDFESAASVVQFNGNDSISLMKGATVIDQIGLDGLNPGSAFVVGGLSTLDHTLVRKPAVTHGETDWTIAATTWLVLGVDTFDGFGTHTTFWQCP